MSIYATLAEIGIKRFGDKEFIAILVQGVPPHIDDVGSAWDFLPPPVDPDGEVMRAVFFVEPGDEKGTPRCGQEYVRPLLVLTGEEYGRMSFPDVIAKLEEAFDVKYRNRPGAIFIKPDGTQEKLF
jgi:hypothetical protein